MNAYYLALCWLQSYEYETDSEQDSDSLESSSSFGTWLDGKVLTLISESCTYSRCSYN